MVRQVKKGQFEVVDSPKAQLSLIKDATMSSITVADIDGKKGEELLVAQNNFARSLIFKDGKNFSVVDQYNAKSSESNVSAVAAFDVGGDKRVEILLVDGQKGQRGALFFPNTLCLIKNAPHPEAGKKLIEYLLSPKVEEALARGPSAQIPLNPAVKATTRVATPATVEAMTVDWDRVASEYEAAMDWVRPYIK